MAKSGMTLTGDKELDRAFQQLPDRVQRKVARQAVSAALTPMVKAAKRLAPKDEGLLKKSIGKKVKTYRNNGVTWGAVGARSGFKTVIDGKVHDPRKIIHLVEFGAKAHVIKPKARKALSVDGQARAIVHHPGTEGTRFMIRAHDQTRGAVLNTLSKKLGSGIEREAKKLSART